MKKIKILGFTFALLSTLLSFGSTIGQNTEKEQKHHTIQLNKKDFLDKVYDYEKNPKKWVYKGNKPAIIDFYADWCGPCIKTAPILEALAKEYGDKIVIYKVDTQKERELSAAFGIQSLPSLLFIPLGEAPQLAKGALPKEAFEEAIAKVLKVKK